jgi:hypothetical protein
VRKPFLVCWKRHPSPLVYKIWVREMFFILHYKYPKKLYKKLDTNSCFVKLRAIIQICSVFFIHPVYMTIILKNQVSKGLLIWSKNRQAAGRQIYVFNQHFLKLIRWMKKLLPLQHVIQFDISVAYDLLLKWIYG